MTKLNATGNSVRVGLTIFVVNKLPEDGTLAPETCKGWYITWNVFCDLYYYFLISDFFLNGGGGVISNIWDALLTAVRNSL